MKDVRHIPVVLAGSARERGRTSGRLQSGAIVGHLNAWLGNLAAPPVKDSVVYLGEMLEKTDYLASCEEHCPDLVEEVRGIAEGANLPFELMFGLQLLDEEWVYRRHRFCSPKPDKCSSLAVVESQDCTWIAQNMDLGTYTEGHQALLQIEEQGEPSSLIFSLAGMIGLLGVNAAGVGVCVNSLPQEHSASTGVPVAFVIRKLLQSRSFDEAVALVHLMPHATSQHYLIAAPGRARSFEAGPEGVVEFTPLDPTRLFHTNHRLAHGTGAEPLIVSQENSEARLLALQQRLGGAIDLEAIQLALTSQDDPLHPVCRPIRLDSGQTGYTTGSLIAALRSAPEIWTSIGPPSLEGYRRYSFHSGSSG